MKIDVITGFPDLMRSPLNESIIRQAKLKKLVRIRLHDLRRYTHDRHRTIDDTPYGGGPGMVLKPEPFFEAVETLSGKTSYDEVIYMSADGERLDQGMANRLSMRENLLVLCGHYKGVDERVRTSLVTKEISVGDYVLTGGELPALVLIDAVVRLIPGVLGDGTSMLGDSFQEDLLDHPSYTRPAEFRGMRVPEILLSGDHRAVERWRKEQRLSRTKLRRRDLLK